MNRSMLTVNQVSKLAGVSPRTLLHYDAIGLLKPSRVGEKGYRYYAQEALLRLQQILFYRELDIPLDDIEISWRKAGSMRWARCKAIGTR